MWVLHSSIRIDPTLGLASASFCRMASSLSVRLQNAGSFARIKQNSGEIMIRHSRDVPSLLTLAPMGQGFLRQMNGLLKRRSAPWHVAGLLLYQSDRFQASGHVELCRLIRVWLGLLPVPTGRSAAPR